MSTTLIDSAQYRLRAASIVKEARKHKGLEQETFGKLIHSSQSLISKYERGKVPVPSEIVLRCMEMIGMVENADPTADQVADSVRLLLKAPEKAALRRALLLLIDSVADERQEL